MSLDEGYTNISHVKNENTLSPHTKQMASDPWCHGKGGGGGGGGDDGSGSGGGGGGTIPCIIPGIIPDIKPEGKDGDCKN